jgi:hypothetical protein
MRRAQLRDYLGGVPWTEVEERMRTGRIPAPLYGLPPVHPNARWDRKAVDRALDAESGIPLSIEQDILEMDRAIGYR